MTEVESKSARYITKIKRCDWAALRQLWGRIQERRTPGWPSGKAFEYLVLRAFELDGASVTWPYGVQLQGQLVEQIDGLIECDGISCLVESKDHAGDLNIEPLAKLRNQLLRRPAGVVGCVFSSSGFTDPAKTLAQFVSPQAILLWNGPELGSLLERGNGFAEALKMKRYWLIRSGTPDYDVRAELFL